MSEEFMRTSANDTEFVIMKHLDESEPQVKKYSFTTDYNGVTKTLQVEMESELIGDALETLNIDMEAEMLSAMKGIIQSELECLTSR